MATQAGKRSGKISQIITFPSFFRVQQSLILLISLGVNRQMIMTAPIGFTHSPFLYHHVPNSPYLLPSRSQAFQSPAPFVPDIDNQRDNRRTTNGLHYYASNASTRSPYPVNQSLFSPTPVVPSISAPSTPQPQRTTTNSVNVSSPLHKEQVVPHFSPLVKKEKDSSNRKERRLDASLTQATAPEINLFSGEDIFA